MLSGMNSDKMVKDNLNTASTTEIGEITESDEEMLRRVVRAINHKQKVGCTGCGYCMPCPQKINISEVFSAYNNCYMKSRVAGFSDYVKCTSGKNAPASSCIGCGKCESHCPQSISIREELNNVAKELEGASYKAVRAFSKKNKA